MIPKIIHYCWFGNSPKPEIVKECIESWHKYCPDWQIKEWNEKNLDVMAIPYMNEAYKSKKWAFVSDVARLLVIYREGGIYLDTDVELLAPIDSWLDSDAFYAFESNRNIASGLGFGAVKRHASVEAMLKYYEKKHFIVNGKPKMVPCPDGNTEALKTLYPVFKRDGTSQKFEGVKVLSAADYLSKAVHHGAMSWVKGAEKRKKPYRETRLKTYLRDSRVFDFLEKYCGKRTVKIYTFLAYDFLEMGITYYIKRLLKRLFCK